jgi:hypothetical protein
MKDTVIRISSSSSLPNSIKITKTNHSEMDNVIRMKEEKLLYYMLCKALGSVGGN